MHYGNFFECNYETIIYMSLFFISISVFANMSGRDLRMGDPGFKQLLMVFNSLKAPPPVVREEIRTPR